VQDEIGSGGGGRSGDPREAPSVLGARLLSVVFAAAVGDDGDLVAPHS